MANGVPTSIGSYVMPRTAAPPRPKPVNPLGGLLSDPLVAQASANQQQQNTLANAGLRQQRSQALIDYGSPQLANSLGAAVDPNTASAAGANQYSTLANLAHANTLAGRHLLNHLAASGLLHSGATGAAQGELARNYGQAQSSALSQLLGSLNQQLGGYLGTTQTSQNDYVNALLNSFSRYGANPLGVPGG